MREIRVLTEQDVDSLTRITVNAYPGFRPENYDKHRENFLRSMAEANSIQFYGLFEGDKLLGSMRLHDFRMQLHSRRIAAGGVGMVAVDLMHKKEKVCKEMIEFFLNHLRGQGTSLALLYPFRPDFYKQMGFGYGSKMHRYSIPPAQVPRRGDKDKVRFLTAVDREQLGACYTRILAGSNGLLERRASDWDKLLANPALWVVGCVDNGQVIGYLTFTFKGHSPDGFLWNDMVVPEFFWENTDALNQMLAFLHSQADQISRIIFHTQDDNFHCLFFDPRSGIEEVVHPVAQQTNISAAGIMYRVTDVDKVFLDLAGHRFGGPDICLGLHIRDSFIPANNGTYTIAFKDGVAEAAVGGNWDIQLSLDIAEFSSLLVGAVDVRTLLNLGLAQISDHTQAGILNEVFRAEKPICVTGF